MDLNHLSIRSGLTHLQVPLMVSPGFFCRLSVVFPVFSIIYYGEFCLHVATNLFCVFVFYSEISGLSNVPHGEDQFGFTHFDPQLFPLCNRNMLQPICFLCLYFVQRYLTYQMYHTKRISLALHILIFICFLLATETGLPTCIQ